MSYEWRRLGEPGAARLIDAATVTCADLARDSAPQVLLHGDFHFVNVLAGTQFEAIAWEIAHALAS